MYEGQRAGSGLPAFPSPELTSSVATLCLPFKGGCGEMAELQKNEEKM